MHTWSPGTHHQCQECKVSVYPCHALPDRAGTKASLWNRVSVILESQDTDSYKRYVSMCSCTSPCKPSMSIHKQGILPIHTYSRFHNDWLFSPIKDSSKIIAPVWGLFAFSTNLVFFLPYKKSVLKLRVCFCARPKPRIHLLICTRQPCIRICACICPGIVQHQTSPTWAWSRSGYPRLLHCQNPLSPMHTLPNCE